MSRLNTWIIEDEPPAQRRLEKLLANLRPEATVSYSTDTISSAKRALNEQPEPDLIFSDIQLADGLSFDIWSEAEVDCPIIFTTAYDQYAIRAFAVNSVDYLLKPIDEDKLSSALDKFEQRRGSSVASGVDIQALSRLIAQRKPAYRERFVLQHRNEYLSVRTSDFAQFYSKDGLTFGLTHAQQRYLVPETLDRLVEELDPAQWFRISRGQLVHIEAVERASPYFNHRLSLALKPTLADSENLVSRQRVKDFLAWWGK